MSFNTYKTSNNMRQLKMDILGELPPEIAQIVLMYLSPDDLVNISDVSNRWRQLVNNDHVWSRHMPYHKYVEKYWHDAVGESYDEGEGCRLMEKYLTESRIKNNMKQGNYNVITSSPLTFEGGGREVFSIVDGFLLANGELLKFKNTNDMRHCTMTLSSDLRLLAVRDKNFLYIYERKSPTVEFELLSLLAGCPATEEEHDGSKMLSVVSCPKLDEESVALFLRKHNLYYTLECLFITGVDSPDERRVCLQLEEDDYFECSPQPLYGLWDIHRNRLVKSWKSDYRSLVIEGWDSRGVCVAYDTDRIEYYDVDMRPLTVIPINKCSVIKIEVSYNFSVAVIISNNQIQLVMWEKDSTEYRVLIDNYWALKMCIACVSPSTVAYFHSRDTVAIIAAPHWQVVAHVKIHYDKYLPDFRMTEFSDGSLFVVTQVGKDYKWHDIGKRNTTDISEWPIDRGHEFKLPDNSIILMNKGLKFTVVEEGITLLRIIDYNK